MKINREKTIFDVLYSKQAFLNNENIGFKTHKIGIFPKGLVHGFDQKIGNFVNVSFYSKIHREKVFGEVLVRKQAFLDNINMDLKREQNGLFCKADRP